MSEIENLIAWFTQQVDYDDRVARGTHGRRGTPPAEGEHWQWVDPDTDIPLTLNPVTDEIVGGDITYKASLRSVEEYEGNYGTLPSFIIHAAEEVPILVGMHMVNWDAARVIRECAAKRELAQELLDTIAWNRKVWADYSDWVEGKAGPVTAPRERKDVNGMYRALRLLAVVYADRPGYDGRWRP